MDKISDILGNKNIILDSIKKYGHAPEHNFWHFLNLQNKNDKCVYFDFKNNTGIMAQIYKNGSSEMVSEVLAPEDKKIEIFEEFLECMLLKMKLKKAFVFVSADFKNQIQILAQKSGYHLSRARTYYSPIFNLKNFDERLPGKAWKKIRNIRNRFYKENKVEGIPSADIKKEKLRDIVFQWKRNKNSYGRAEFIKYLNIIENSFNGAKYARTLVVNGIPSTITVGWDIPNSNVYYSAIGIHNYKYKHLGEIENLDDLLYLKSTSHHYANFGTSDKSLLAFKKKFNPESIAKFHYFSVRKRDWDEKRKLAPQKQGAVKIRNRIF